MSASDGVTCEPVVVAAEMGYGHLRPATSLADALGVEVLRADVAPLAGEAEAKLWSRSRRLYELTSRLSQRAFVGRPFRRLLFGATAISDLHPYRDQSRPTRPVKTLAKWIDRGIGEGLLARLAESGRPLLTTFYAPAIAADRHGDGPVYCVVTDTDVHRIWAPFDPAATRIRYLVPSLQALRRLRAYGVPRENISFTGFPLPAELTAEDRLRADLSARLVRLDPDGVFRKQLGAEVRPLLGDLPEGRGEPPLLTYAVGGAGAQTGVVRSFLPGVRELVESGRLRLALVAGVRPEVAALFRKWLADAGLGNRPESEVRILCEDDFDAYYRRFNELLHETDVLWTKPSELVFYGALGIPLVFSWPVGAQEKVNRRWTTERGAGLKQLAPRHAHLWLVEWLSEGILAAAAWSGFVRLPRRGTENVLAALREDHSPETR